MGLGEPSHDLWKRLRSEPKQSEQKLHRSVMKKVSIRFPLWDFSLVAKQNSKSVTQCFRDWAIHRWAAKKYVQPGDTGLDRLFWFIYESLGGMAYEQRLSIKTPLIRRT